jgi:hypothetical protein
MFNYYYHSNPILNILKAPANKDNLNNSHIMASLTLPKQSLVILLVMSLEMVIYTYKQLTNNDRFANTEAGKGEFNPHNHNFKEQKNPFESALRDVTALAKENESTFDNGGKRTRPHFNLTEWTTKHQAVSKI